MFPFEIEIAKAEAISPVCSYPYKVIPLTDQAKLAFATYNKKSGPFEKNVYELVKNHLNVDKEPFIGQIGFYYDDQNDEQRKGEVKSLVLLRMANSGVPGIFHQNSNKKSYFNALTEGVDFKVEVGEKIVHEPEKPLTFDDIKAL